MQWRVPSPFALLYGKSFVEFFFFLSFGIEWVLSERVEELLFGWRNGLGKFSSDIWNKSLYA